MNKTGFAQLNGTRLPVDSPEPVKIQFSLRSLMVLITLTCISIPIVVSVSSKMRAKSDYQRYYDSPHWEPFPETEEERQERLGSGKRERKIERIRRQRQSGRDRAIRRFRSGAVRRDVWSK